MLYSFGSCGKTIRRSSFFGLDGHWSGSPPGVPINVSTSDFVYVASDGKYLSYVIWPVTFKDEPASPCSPLTLLTVQWPHSLFLTSQVAIKMALVELSLKLIPNVALTTFLHAVSAAFSLSLFFLRYSSKSYEVYDMWVSGSV